jgi:hypothetical protein
MPATAVLASGCSPKAARHLRRLVLTALALVPLAWTGVHAGDPPTPPGKVRIVSPDGDGAKYWSRWRGPSGQGVVADGTYPDTWSGKDNVRWRGLADPRACLSSPARRMVY